ncbi:ROK family protein [Roseofilum sp. BLCC_M154]|uniref:ROK family protein n=1 Tax=Roseofilum acuticapitatum BLCC-M154 TaxID=3022444 RepID=A0ABT7AT67_9CYAN|nr:ROK family protein [Roseofilum acuticapitatum]MDJ1169253.1 ROK family protein [Roseofilum acuticapitatum BLCC-M154]
MARSKSTAHTLAIDIGGSGIKAMVLDHKGHPLGDRLRVQTPQPPTPESVLGAIADLAKQAGAFDRVSVGFPGVVRQGIVYTAINLHPDWVEFDLASTLSESLAKPVRVANDADIQGFGAISGQGVELAITLGTGFGTALFVEGKLVPNLEGGHHPFRKKQTYEEQLGRAALEKVGTKKWNKRLKKAIVQLQHLFNTDHLYLGGGEAKKVDFELPKNVSIVPNINGLLGGIALWK